LIRFKVENGTYEVIEYGLEHDHEFLSERQKHLIKCGRMISDACKHVLDDMAKASIGVRAYKFLANEREGSQNLAFILRNC